MRPKEWMRVRGKRLSKKIVCALFDIGLRKFAQSFRSHAFSVDEIHRQISHDILLKGPGELKRRLGVDEDSFRFVDGPEHRDAREYYCYGVADEIMKVGVAAIHWEELLEGPDPDPAVTSINKNIARVVIERVCSEQEMWVRKLTEHLLNLICLSSHNTEPVFRAFVAAQSLDDHLGLDLDFQDFYACRNENNRYSINSYATIIDQIQARENVRPLPLFAGVLNPSALPRPGQVLQGVRKRFKKALLIATREEKIALRLSYAAGFSESSRSIHALIQDRPKQKVEQKEIAARFNEVGLIATHMLNRMYTLCSIKPEGFSKQIIDSISHPESNAPALFRQIEQQFQPGDFVLLTGQVAQVIRTNTSPFGYTSVRARYLSQPLLPNVHEDEFPAKYLRLIIPVNGVREFMVNQVGRMPAELQKIVRESLINTDDSLLIESVKTALVQMHKDGVFSDWRRRKA